MFSLSTLHLILSWALPFILVLSLLVFVHELGHYLVARKAGVRIETFSIGFGPEIFGFNDKAGTRWKFSLIPLGGYVKMFGDANEASVPDFEHARSLSLEEKSLTLEGKTVGQRIAVSAAGPFSNIVLAFVLLTGAYYMGGVPSSAPVLGSIQENSPAFLAGLRPGDKISSVEGRPISTYKQLQDIINGKPGTPLKIQVSRGSLSFERTVTPQSLLLTPKVTVGVLGIKPWMDPVSLLEAPVRSLSALIHTAGEIFSLLGSIFVKTENLSKLGSILSIAKMAKDSLDSGIPALLSFMAILSLNLGLINLLPIPGLDGGHLFFYLIEAVRGKPVPPRAQEILFKIGFGILIGIMLFTLWNDLLKFSVVEKVTSLFS